MPLPTPFCLPGSSPCSSMIAKAQGVLQGTGGAPAPSSAVPACGMPWSHTPPRKDALPSSREGGQQTASSCRLRQGQPRMQGVASPKITPFLGPSASGEVGGYRTSPSGPKGPTLLGNIHSLRTLLGWPRLAGACTSPLLVPVATPASAPPFTGVDP